MHSQFRGGTEPISKARLSIARAVLRYSEPLAHRVMAGQLSLDQAFRDTQEAEGEDLNRARRLRTLRERRPDLADAVAEDVLTLARLQAILRRPAEPRTNRGSVPTRSLL